MKNTLIMFGQRCRLGLSLFVQLLLIHGLMNVPAWAGVFTRTGQARQLQHLQLRSDEDEISAVLELDGLVSQFSVVALTAPDRVIVYLQGVRNARGEQFDYNQLLTPQMRKTGLEQLLIAQTTDDLRITFYTSRKLRYDVQRSSQSITLTLTPAKAITKELAPKPVAPGDSPRTLTQAWQSPSAEKSWSGKAPITESASQRAGKKSFAEGLKYEKKQQWDLAFQNYLVAINAEPDNPEYRLHAQRAAQNATLLLTQQGDVLINQNDFEGAMRAYKSAVSFDATNEQARTKLQMLRTLIQKVSGPTPEPVNQPSTSSAAKGDQAIYFNNANLRQVIEMLANNLGLNVMFDESFRDEPKFRLKLENVSLAKALDQILLQSKHTFERTDRRTILIYQDNPQNRQRFEQLMFKTFYLSNADPVEARTLVQAVIGQQRQVLPVKHLNALVVRDTPSNLQIVQELLDSIDKNRAEVLVDVDIYEVSRSTSTAIGNQIATSAVTITTPGTGTAAATTKNSASLGNLGGIGLNGITSIAGQIATGGLGTIIGLPPSTLSLLKSKSNSKLLASTQIHALDGEQNQTKVGRSVPVRIGTTVIPSVGTTPATSGITTGNFDSIQYRDVGLIIDLTPTVNNEGWVQIKMKLESSSVETAATGQSLTPSFSQRALTTIARVMDGRTAIVAGVKQETKGDSRSGLPVIGMVPILGRLFSTPQEESSLSDIIITVTPHVVRATTIRPEDYRARIGGSFLTGVSASVEDLLHRVEEEERQNRNPLRNPSTVVAMTSGASATRKEANPPINPPPTNDSNESALGPQINFSLTPNVATPTVNESFYVAVTIAGAQQISEALFALSYDPSLLQLKSIQNGALLGKQATITPQGENGTLRFQIQQEANQPSVQAEGQLLILEFAGLKAGKTTISFINGEQGIKLGQPLPAQFQLQGTEVTVK